MAAAASVPPADLPAGILSGPHTHTHAHTHTDVDTRIIPDVLALKDEIVENRRHLHAHPELSFQEVQTAKFVADKLRSYGISEVWEGIGRTGVVALIRGAATGLPGDEHARGHAGELMPCIALRADMDALPLQETADVPYRSRNAGVMHACGHDGHVAGLLATAKVLFERRASLRGCVKLLFQPAEEGLGGAREMIKDGCLTATTGCEVTEVYGLHLWSYDPLGTVCVKDGPLMAASDKFEIACKGKGGHGAQPAGTVDAIVEAAHLVTALQTITSRNVDPTQSAVVTCGTIRGGSGYNIIADDVTITGTTRSFSKPMQSMIETRMNDICKGVAAAFGGEITLAYKYGYPCTDNAYPCCTASVMKAAESIVGTGKNVPQITCGAEDFSYFLQAKPGCFFFVGAALPGDPRPHHKSVFDFDEKAILIGASIFCTLVVDKLGAHKV